VGAVLCAPSDSDSWPRWPLPARVVALAALAAFQVGGTFGASEGQPDRRDADAGALLLALVAPVALVWARRRPVPVVWVVGAATLTYLLADYAYGPVLLGFVLAVGNAVVRGHRAAAWSTVAVLLVVHVGLGGVWRDEGWSWQLPLGVTAWTLVVLGGAELVRVRGERAGAARRAAAETAQRRANEERLRIAREVHDLVAHHMSLINVQAGVALHLVERRPEQAQPALLAIRDASKEALVELRSLVAVLREEGEVAPRTPVSMLDTLDDLVARTAHAGLTVDRTVAGDVRSLPAPVGLAAARIVQESITNVVRHSGARRAVVGLEYGPDTLAVQVDDDGTGGPVAVGAGRATDVDAGNGLRGMRERAVALGGTLTVGAAPGGGFRVRAVLPTGEQP